MSGEIGRPPLDVVEVEVVEDDESGGRVPDTMESVTEVDSDAEILETVADLLSNGPWLSRGSERGERLCKKLVDLGEKLEAWKRWERLCHSKEEERSELRERLKESELRFEMMKGSKAVLRKTYDLEIERRIKVELEIAELKRKAFEGVVDSDLRNVGVQTKASSEPFSSITVLQGSDPQAHVANIAAVMEVVVSSSSRASSLQNMKPALQHQEFSSFSDDEVSDDDDKESLAEAGERIAVASDSSSSLLGTSLNLRRRSGRVVRKNAQKEHGELASDEDTHDDKDEPASDSSARKRRKDQRRLPDKSSSGGQRFQCGRCKAILSTQYNLDHHTKKVHAKEARGNFSCYVCNKGFLQKSHFMQHLKTHPRKQSYRCKTCNKIYTNKRNLHEHVKIHDPNRRKDFVCPTCFKRFVTSQQLTNHLVTHRSERPFKCPQCPRRFKLAYLAKRHLVSHSNLKPFKCELCEKTFKRSKELKAHIQVHTGERPYTCQICKKRFIRGDHLNLHMRTHQGEEGKIHQCPFCDMKFSRMSSCRRHQQSRHKLELASSAQPE